MQPLLVGLTQPGQTKVRVFVAAKIHACCGLMHPSELIQPEGLLHLLPEGLLHREGLIQPAGVPAVVASRAGVPGVSTALTFLLLEIVRAGL